MTDFQPPAWILGLSDEDFAFIKKFILASGSLKEMAEAYKVTYPTVRLRLDKLIQKISIAENEKNDGFVSLIKNLALDEKISVETAKLLINVYKKGDR